jgi:hypothetical protein
VEARGELHTLDGFTPYERALVSIGKEAGWTLALVWILKKSKHYMQSIFK